MQTKKALLEIESDALNRAEWLAEEQLRRAHEVVTAFSHHLTSELHHQLVGAVVQAIATNMQKA